MIKEVKEELNKILKKYRCGNIEYLQWWWVCGHEQLSENFIREFKDKVLWNIISFRQNLSDDFIREFKYKLWLDHLIKEKKISQQFYNELKNEKINRFELLDFE